MYYGKIKKYMEESNLKMAQWREEPKGAYENIVTIKRPKRVGGSRLISTLMHYTLT